MSTNKLYAVVRSGTTRDQFAEAVRVLGLERYQVLEGDGDKLGYQEIWVTPAKDHAIRYIEDPILGMAYLCFQGAKRRRLVRDLKIRLHPPEEVIGMAQRARKHNAQVDAIGRVAITFPDYDEEAFAIFTHYLQAPSPLLRQATLNAMGYRCWAEFIPLMEAAAEHDPEAEVREKAAVMLSACRAYLGK